MKVSSNYNGYVESDDPMLELFHLTRGNPKEVICVRDNPPMTGFGRTLLKGDKVIINGTVSTGSRFEVAVPAECAFYDYTYFEPGDNFFNE